MASTLAGDQPMMRGAQRAGPGAQTRRGRAGDPAWLAEAPGSADPLLVGSISDYYSQMGQSQAALEAGHQAALDSLSGLLASPTHGLLQTELTRRADPGYSIVSPAQESAMNRQVALATTRARDERARRLRQAGLAGSGMDIENAGLYTTLGSVGLGGVQAGIAEANAAAQERALAGLDQLGRFDALVTGDIARLQADPVLSGVDPFLGSELFFGRQQYFDAQAFQDEMLRLMEEESQFGWQDFGNLLLAGANLFI